jgi:hypothetical protein
MAAVAWLMLDLLFAGRNLVDLDDSNNTSQLATGLQRAMVSDLLCDN